MSTSFLVNKIRYGTRTLHPGASIDSAQDDVAGIQANGGYLVPSSNATVAAAATLAQGLSARGQWQEAAFIMLAAAAQAGGTDVSSTSSGKGASLIAIEDAGGLYTAADVEAALAEVRTIADALTGAVKRTVTIAYNNAALVAANSNGAAATVNIGAVLPANARILSCDARSFTAFAGASMATFNLQIGSSGDVDAIVSACDLLTAAVDGGPSTFTRGIRPNKTFATASAQLTATLTPDASHKCSDLTSGSITLDVFYFVAA